MLCLTVNLKSACYAVLYHQVCLLCSLVPSSLYCKSSCLHGHTPPEVLFWLCRFFEAGACELRIGVYESFDTLCIYLESDALASPERNFWVKYRIAVVNQRHPDRTEWKDSAICTKTWNNSVLQFMKVQPTC